MFTEKELKQFPRPIREKAEQRAKALMYKKRHGCVSMRELLIRAYLQAIVDTKRDLDLEKEGK